MSRPTFMFTFPPAAIPENTLYPPDYGYNIADAHGNPISPTKDTLTPGTVHVHDLQATILHLLGIDHTRLIYKYQGRDYRLTDVFGTVVKDLIA